MGRCRATASRHGWFKLQQKGNFFQFFFLPLFYSNQEKKLVKNFPSFDLPKKVQKEGKTKIFLETSEPSPYDEPSELAQLGEEEGPKASRTEKKQGTQTDIYELNERSKLSEVEVGVP